jgi:hypothetical protein
MTGRELAARSCSSSLNALARSCRQPPAANLLDAVKQTIAFLSGVYASRFQPSDNAALAWEVVFSQESVTPAELGEAVLAFMRDRSTVDGVLRTAYPPGPPELLARIHDVRERRARARRDYDAACLSWARDPERAHREGRRTPKAGGGCLTPADIDAMLEHGRAVAASRGEAPPTAAGHFARSAQPTRKRPQPQSLPDNK